MKIALSLCAFILAVVGAYYYFLYPPSVYKHSTNRALQQFTDAVNRKDRAAASAALQSWLADNASIHLEIVMGSMGQPTGAPMAQDFSKTDFIQFVDNTLYSLTTYGDSAALSQFSLSADRTAATITFTSEPWGEGASYYGGMGVPMRFTAEATCQGEIAFEQKNPRLTKASCHMDLHMLPAHSGIP